ncbi:MAG TPA: type III-B CRISPR-associated protein Cas10/Cmr2, partial [Acidobacteriota bacterium]|nr:type III-B CRISPR-associated protein Cas10/Cmr2 [Acidobacteriota bacterium]
MAYLHDPPDKPLGIAGHVERAETYQDRGDLGVSDAVLDKADLTREEFSESWKVCDHTAAAADRFPFPAPQKLSSKFGDGETAHFLHPLGGTRWALKIPSLESAEETLQVCQPEPPREWDNGDERWWANFFLHWRRWPRAAAEKDGSLLYLPADTRIPDHSIWTHMAVVSALESCVEGTGNQARLRPAFLLFQLGPVQDFIQQARSTRDLWSGSYLLSWLMAHAMKAVTDQVGPDAVIFPSLRGQPIFDLLHRSELYDRSSFKGRGEREESLWRRLGFES